MKLQRVLLVSRTFLAVCGACLLTWSGTIAGPTSERAWKHYRNARWGFCLDYPASWKASFGTDGSGIRLKPDRSSAELTIGGLPNQREGDPNNSSLMTLEQNFSVSLSGLKQYEHASHVVVLKKHALTFHSYPALDTTIEYRTRNRRTPAAWIERTIFINKHEVIFTADLKAPPERFQRLEPIFNEIVIHRFELVCSDRE